MSCKSGIFRREVSSNLSLGGIACCADFLPFSPILAIFWVGQGGGLLQSFFHITCFCDETVLTLRPSTCEVRPTYINRSCSDTAHLEMGTAA